MNKSDRIKIERIRAALAAVPYPHDGGGTKTASVAGFVHFQKDMRVVKSACEEALFLLCCPDPDLTQEENNQEFERAIRKAEQYIETRKALGW
ncbi:hypothetical protein [Undibacterium oligocarboniphilum]|uniref:Uncharacterized protein n=1 Tax=Undibacterium oligocarboniphilum TaxID=666702 RepID=A0A850QMP7_9BURK|nr:hypothetical protein [Undibacterium oligocarboniphilum]MBC3871519.1 hypothetical protein [Undibacterium oligocarboniphilum]NVO78905.1 hypothetical protein [Undibacterium oligocarboniphilum]